MEFQSSKKLLASIFSNGVIMQRDYPIKIWGWSTENTLINICFSEAADDYHYETKTKKDGAWEFVLPPRQAGGPYELTVTTHHERITIYDILLGDVWVCSGQSNMELPMSRVKQAYPNEAATNSNSEIRQLAVGLQFDFHGEQIDIPKSDWIPVHPKHTPQFSATGYFFAKKLYEQFQVPIGLIMVAVGGTPIQAWMSRQALQPFPKDLAIANRCQDDDYVHRVQEEEKERSDTWYQTLDELDIGLRERWFGFNYNDNSWSDQDLCTPWFENSDLQRCGSIWFRLNIDVPEKLSKKPARLFMGCIVDADYIYVNGALVGNTTYQYPPREYPVANLRPGGNVIAIRVIACHSMGGFVKDKPYKLVWDETEMPLTKRWKYKRAVSCEPLAPTTFFHYKPTGVYNGMIAPLHKYAIKGVIWYQGESNTTSPEGYYERFHSMVIDWRNRWSQGVFPFLFVQLANFDPPTPAVCWAFLREEQRKSLIIPHTAMVVTIDVGEYNDLHPLNKKTVGDRLALAAYRLAYGLDIVHSGPCLSSIKKTQTELILEFTATGSGLTAKDSEVLHGFSICDSDGQRPVQGIIKENTVILSAPKIDHNMTIKYAWSDNPWKANLYNLEGFPASPFIVKLN